MDGNESVMDLIGQCAKWVLIDIALIIIKRVFWGKGPWPSSNCDLPMRMKLRQLSKKR